MCSENWNDCTCGRAAWPRQQPSLHPARKRWPLTCRWCHRSWSGSWGGTPGDPEKLQAGRVCTELPWQQDRNGQPSSVISDRRTTVQKTGVSEAGVRTVECFVWLPRVGDLQKSKRASDPKWAKVTGLVIKSSIFRLRYYWIQVFRRHVTTLTSQNFPADCAGWGVAPSSCSNPCRCRTSTLCSSMRSSVGTPGSHSHLHVWQGVNSSRHQRHKGLPHIIIMSPANSTGSGSVWHTIRTISHTR